MPSPAILSVGSDDAIITLTATRVQDNETGSVSYTYKYVVADTDGTVSEHEVAVPKDGLPYSIRRWAELQGLHVETMEAYNSTNARLRNLGAEDARYAIRAQIINWAREEGVERDIINSLLSHLNMDEWCNKWDVCVEYGYGDSLTVYGVEAEDEDDAIELVRDSLSFTVQITVEYDGDGSCDDAIECEESDTDWVMDNLSFTATPSSDS